MEGQAGWAAQAAKLGWTMGRIPTEAGVQADSESWFQFMFSLCWNVLLPFLTVTHFKNPVQIIFPFSVSSEQVIPSSLLP